MGERIEDMSEKITEKHIDDAVKRIVNKHDDLGYNLFALDCIKKSVKELTTQTTKKFSNTFQVDVINGYNKSINGQKVEKNIDSPLGYGFSVIWSPGKNVFDKDKFIDLISSKYGIIKSDLYKLADSTESKKVTSTSMSMKPKRTK